jgi:hypothetical protein
MLGELHRKATEGRAVDAREESLDDTLSDDLDPAKAGNFRGI